MGQRREDGKDYNLPVTPRMDYTESSQIIRLPPEKGVYNVSLDMDGSVSCYSTEVGSVMKTIQTLALLFSVASTVKCQIAALGGNYVDPAIQGPKVPMVWLIWDDHGVEKYSPGYRLGEECHRDLFDYKGIWIQADPRPPQSQKGCGISYSNGDCTGSVHKFKLEFTEIGRTKTPLGQPELSARSFQFTEVSSVQAICKPLLIPDTMLSGPSQLSLIHLGSSSGGGRID